MYTHQARRWLILASLISCGCAFVFLILSPTLGYPISFQQAIRVMEIVVPVFLGYLGSAAHFTFRKKNQRRDVKLDNPDLVLLLIKGPIYLFAVATLATLFAFGFTNRQAAPPGAGMSVDVLATVMTAILGILTVTTNVAVAYLFALDEGDQMARTAGGGSVG